MPYIYKDSPDWREKASSSFSDSFAKSLESTMLRKRQKSDDAEKLKQQIELAGLQEIPSGVSADEYESVIDLGGKKLGKPLTSYVKEGRIYEKQKRELEMKKLKSEINDPHGLKSYKKKLEIANEMKPKATPKPAKVPSAEIGKYTLAKDSINNIDNIMKTLFPSGGAESFRRDIATAANPPLLAKFTGALPFAEEAQNVARWYSTALAARQLIQTGVAARPEETERLTKSFVSNMTSNPKSAHRSLQELQKFYKDYITNLKESSDISNISVDDNDDQSAVEWATANPTDPRAVVILEGLGR